ncbi:hypothetical protein [Sphingomonas hengshuiensis]|uniref:Uncharacterized protein n=1 Tax=Sphingomonas hengshuiensis TaxID=1609977 RepID=A0A7U4J8S1_9SPHN|nr:hypothetical protein [Sphingomonas hengshuiensis]AJP72346.1 hypothetical protein TS85_11970 [Sphingomonas hengshuiensis]
MRVRLLMVGVLVALGGCGGGGTTGTNYSDAPPMAEIVATPSPRASATPDAPPDETPAYAITNEDAEMLDNAAD